MKRCSLCGDTKPLEAFRKGRDRRGIVRRTSGCKACLNAQAKAKREADPEIQRKRAALAAEIDRERETGLRICTACGAEKPLEEYHKRPRRHGARGGRVRRCKACVLARDPRERARERERRYYEKNREAVIARTVAWGEANPIRHRELRNEVLARRRARQVDQFVAHVDRAVIFQRDGGLCGICGHPVEPSAWELDHIVPIARGGTHEPGNVQVAHKSCNRRKHTKLLKPQMALPLG